MLKLNDKLTSLIKDLKDATIIELQQGCVVVKDISGKELAFTYCQFYRYYKVV